MPASHHCGRTMDTGDAMKCAVCGVSLGHYASKWVKGLVALCFKHPPKDESEWTYYTDG